jgi:beta-lactamase superfamily II metal-dependent hydrolase
VISKTNKNVKLYIYISLVLVIVTRFTGGCSSGSADTNDTSAAPDSLPQATIFSGAETSDLPKEKTTEPEETTETPVTTQADTGADFEFDFDTETGVMEIFVFDTGKADAILITTKNHTLLIDSGEHKHGPLIADYLAGLGVNEIDYLIITHFHKDHVGGADIILKNFRVNEVIVPDYGKTSKQYAQFNSAVLETGALRLILTQTIQFTLDGAEFSLYPSRLAYYDYSEDDDTAGEDIPNENDFSIVVSAKHGGNNFLFAADAMDSRLGELLSDENIANTKYDYLKVPYHGKYTDGCIELIDAVKARYAVITCSADPSDKSADDRVISALEHIGAEVFLTVNGGVYCVSNGEAAMCRQAAQGIYGKS